MSTDIEKISQGMETLTKSHNRHAAIGEETNRLLTMLLKFHHNSPRVNFEGIIGPAGKDADPKKIIDHVMPILQKAVADGHIKITDSVFKQLLEKIPRTEDLVPHVLKQIRQPVDGVPGKDADPKEVAKHVVPLLVDHLKNDEEFMGSLAGEKGDMGPAGPNVSSDTGEDIIKKIRSLPKNKRLVLDDIEGVPPQARRNDVGYLRELSDIDFGTTDPADGYVVAWSAAKKKFVPVAPSSGGVAFQGKTELSTTTPNGSTQEFAFTHTIGVLLYQGQVQILGSDYTINGSGHAVFTTIVPQVGEQVANLYA